MASFTKRFRKNEAYKYLSHSVRNVVSPFLSRIGEIWFQSTAETKLPVQCQIPAKMPRYLKVSVKFPVHP